MQLKLIGLAVLVAGLLLCTNVVAQNLEVFVMAGSNTAGHAAVALKGPQDPLTSLRGYTDSSGYLLIRNLNVGTTYGYVVDWRDSQRKLWRKTGGITITSGRTPNMLVKLNRPGTFIPDWSPWVGAIDRN